jgi:hypothetical protein
MKITKSQFKQIIKEEAKNVLDESDLRDFGPSFGPDSPNYEFHDDDEGDDPYNTEKYDNPVYQLNDQLVTAAMRAIMEVISGAVEGKLPPKEAKEYVVFAALDLEEPLMDFLLPIAERLMTHSGFPGAQSSGPPLQEDKE